MAVSLVGGWDAVVVVSVTGSAIDTVDIPFIQNAVATGASRAPMFFSDACLGTCPYQWTPTHVATSRFRDAEIGLKARASRPKGFWDRL